MKNKIICALFVLLVFGITAIDLITPVKEKSEWENRLLDQKPEFSLVSLLEGDWGEAYEGYMTDQFVARDTFVKASFVSEVILGKREINDVYVTSDALYVKQPEPNFKYIDSSLSAIKTFAENTGVESYLTVVPSSTYIYRDNLPSHASVYDEKEIFSYIGNNLKSAEFVDITDNLEENSTNYIYFRTDHHWTADGALVGYNGFRKALGKEPLTRDDFEIKKVSDSFIGTTVSKCGAVGIDYDVMERFEKGEVISVDVWDGVESKTYPSVFFEEFLDKKDKYCYYLGENRPAVRIKTGNSDGGRLIVFKDSYSHIMTPLMIDDWSEIVLVDLRYVNKKADALLEEFIGENIADFDVAWFVYSADTFVTQNNMRWVKVDEKNQEIP